MIKTLTKIGNSHGIIFESALLQLAHLKPRRSGECGSAQRRNHFNRNVKRPGAPSREGI